MSLRRDLAAIVLAATLGAPVPVAESTPTIQAGPEGLPEGALELWLCPNHKDQQGFGPETCPIDGVQFEKRFVVGNYVCPMHSHVHGESGERCPICSMSLAPTTLEIEWFCPDSPNEIFHEPGTCADGREMKTKTVPMAHGDHNAKHGGILFMAPDGFHHIEGTLGTDGRFPPLHLQ